MPTMKFYEVDDWVTRVKTFVVAAPNEEEARDRVNEHQDELEEISEETTSMEIGEVRNASPEAMAKLDKLLNPGTVKNLPMDSQGYANFRGIACPFCGSHDLEGNSWNADGGYATQEVNCLRCSKEWLDRYELKGYIET